MVLTDRVEIKLHEDVQEERGNLRQLALAVLGVFGKLSEMQDEILKRIPALISCLGEAYNLSIAFTDEGMILKPVRFLIYYIL